MRSPQWIRNVKNKKFGFWRLDTFFSETKYINKIFIKNGGWHFSNLKTLDELESLVCEKCEKPKINEKYFPGISPEAYWTQTKNRFNSRMYWTVNFMTGYNYSRFFSYQQLPVLLVQDR